MAQLVYMSLTNPNKTTAEPVQEMDDTEEIIQAFQQAVEVFESLLPLVCSSQGYPEGFGLHPMSPDWCQRAEAVLIRMRNRLTELQLPK